MRYPTILTPLIALRCRKYKVSDTRIEQNFLNLSAINSKQAMTYFDRIKTLAEKFPAEIADFSTPRHPASQPTQATSNFITNKEQGDWAENILKDAVNNTSKNYVAVKYGKSDDIIAGDPGFTEFFQEFQQELDAIGKRPDILIFKKADFDENLGYDISHIPHVQIDEYVKKAIAGVEVRSSAYLAGVNERIVMAKISESTSEALRIKQAILEEYADLRTNKKCQDAYAKIGELTEESILTWKLKKPSFRTEERLKAFSDEVGRLNEAVKGVQETNHLSITPKEEDLKVVYKWIETFNVPHYYVQVFFDKMYGISFEDILSTVTKPENEGVLYRVGKDVKNQNKKTIKITSIYTTLLADKIDEPNYEGTRKEMEKGSLLFYIKFRGGTAYLNVDNFKQLFNIEGDF